MLRCLNFTGLSQLHDNNNKYSNNGKIYADHKGGSGQDGQDDG
jgi:hypothetical protein